MENYLAGELDLVRGMEPIPPAPPVAVIGGWELVTVALEQASESVQGHRDKHRCCLAVVKGLDRQGKRGAGVVAAHGTGHSGISFEVGGCLLPLTT
jgi:hypothetical protein